MVSSVLVVCGQTMRKRWRRVSGSVNGTSFSFFFSESRLLHGRPRGKPWQASTMSYDDTIRDKTALRIRRGRSPAWQHQNSIRCPSVAPQPLPIHPMLHPQAMPILHRKLPANRVHTLLREADSEPLSILPAVPEYWRGTPTDLSPFLRNPVSSTIRTPFSPGVVKCSREYRRTSSRSTSAL